MIKWAEELESIDYLFILFQTFCGVWAVLRITRERERERESRAEGVITSWRRSVRFIELVTTNKFL